jgi:hypothetical protein
MMMKELFETPDIWLAAAIACFAGIEPNYSNRNGRIVFLFPKSDAVYRAMSDYNSDEPLPSFTFAQQSRELKGRLMRLKREGANG